MGGPVIVEAARRVANVVIGLIGAETWSLARSQQATGQFIEPFRVDFPAAMEKFVRTSFSDAADQRMVERVVTGMSSASPEIAISVFSEIGGDGSGLKQGLREIGVPKIAINAKPRLSEVDALDLGIPDADDERRALPDDGRSAEVQSSAGPGGGEMRSAAPAVATTRLNPAAVR